MQATGTSAYKAKDFLTAMLHKLPGEITVTRLRADSRFSALLFIDAALMKHGPKTKIIH